jgi:ribosomal protein S18 acetylase RimI-like enzyme
MNAKGRGYQLSTSRSRGRPGCDQARHRGDMMPRRGRASPESACRTGDTEVSDLPRRLQRGHTNEGIADENMRVRGARREDLEGILALARRTGVFTSEEIGVVRELVEAELSNPRQRDYHSLVIEMDARVVGFACYGPTPMTDGTYDLYWIFVHPSYQRRSIGSALLREVERAIEQIRGRMLVVDTSSTRRYSRARRFYENHGFQKAAEVKDFYRVDDSRITYMKQFARESRPEQ